jgi:hypothetical protein
MKIAPHFFVGLGGCGGKIVNELARKMKRNREEYERYRDLVRFIVFDTDMTELAQCDQVDTAIEISNFNKPRYVEHCFGKGTEPENTHFTQWWPEYYQPRVTTGAGAGQIRIESRLSLYYTLRQVHGHRKALEDAVLNSLNVDNKWRNYSKAPIIHIFTSLAGGTGSGSFVPVAYYLASLMKAPPLVTATVVLPSVFESVVPSNQKDKILANGYSALMELEYFQSIDGSAAGDPLGRLPFNWNPAGKEDTPLTGRPFSSVFFVDKYGALGSSVPDVKKLILHVADSTYKQIFTESPEQQKSIVERDRSTLDNSEQDLGVRDRTGYTRRYGAFGLSALTIPDDDILKYCASRWAIEALNCAFVLPEEAEGESQTSTDRDKRDALFVKELQRRARLPGEEGALFKGTFGWCDGPEGVASFFQKLDDQIARVRTEVTTLPEIKDDTLLGFSGDEESVRVEVRKLYDKRKARFQQNKQKSDELCTNLAKEVLEGSASHAAAQCIEGQDPIRQRLFYIRLGEKLRERYAEVEGRFRAAETELAGVDEAFEKYLQNLVATAGIRFVEKFTGNKDYEEGAVPEFMKWYRDTLKKHQEESLLCDGLLDLYDDVLEGLRERVDRAAAVFGDLIAIRRKLQDRCDNLLKFGVARELGGEASEHVLDIEVYQDDLDTQHPRLWNWVFDRDEQREKDYRMGEIAALIQKAQSSAKHHRHIADGVIQALTAHGEQVWELRIRGQDEPQAADEVGLDVVKGLMEEARWALGWSRVKRSFGGERPPRLPREEIEAVMDKVSPDELDSYIKDKIDHAIKKCQPFLGYERDGLDVDPMMYIHLYRGYAEDQDLKKWIEGATKVPFDVSKQMLTDDPKRLVFYWNQMCMPIRSIKGVDDFAEAYEAVRAKMLLNAPAYEKACRYVSARPGREDETRSLQGVRVPTMPIHIDRNFEGFPDPYTRGLFHVCAKYASGPLGRLEWDQRRAARGEEAASAQTDVRLFTLSVWAKAVVKTDAGYVVNKDTIKNQTDRELGKYRDTAYAEFSRTKQAIREWAQAQVEEALRKLRVERNVAPLEAYSQELKDARLGMGDQEVALANEELAALAVVIAEIQKQ